MASNTKNIEDFNLGIICNADMQDIPDNACVYSHNVDPDVQGNLQSIKKNSTSTFSASGGIKRHVWLQQDSTKWDLVVIDDTNNLNICTDFYGSPSAITEKSSATTNSCMQVHNRQVHIGNGTGTTLWLGYISHGQFGGGAPSNQPIKLNAECSIAYGSGSGETKIESATVNEHAESDEDSFIFGKVYQYKISCTYDGYQESPLSTTGVLANVGTGGNSANYITVRIKSYTVSSLNQRITAINLWRSERDFGATDADYEEYKLVSSFSVTSATGWTADGTHYYQDYVDYGTATQTYTTYTGVSETLTSTMIKYSKSGQVENYHFVTGCTITELADATQLIVRSKQGRFDIFDWVNDQLRLKYVPVALVGYSNKLYAFGTNHVTRIDPDGFYIEDDFEGYGCYSDKSVIATEYGLFFCNVDGAYWSDGKNIEKISHPISTHTYSSGVGWDDTFGALTTDRIAVTFLAVKNIVIFADVQTGNSWVYHIIKKRWDYWTLTNNANSVTSHLFNGQFGEGWYCNGTTLYKLFNSSDYESLEWVSKEFADDPSQYKKFYKVKTTGSNYTTTYGKDGSAPTSALTSELLSTSDFKAKSLQFKIVTTSANTITTVKNVGITYRPMVGKR